jgi:hypothetical protein
MRSSSSSTTTIPAAATAARAVGHTHEQKFESGVSAGTGEYLMSLSLGTPPQQFAAIVDTGSDLNWVQCLPCRVCYQQTSDKFDPSRSSTYRDVPCASQLCQVPDNFSCKLLFFLSFSSVALEHLLQNPIQSRRVHFPKAYTFES